MKRMYLPLLILLSMAAGPALAQEDISGTWSGKLPAGPDTTLEIHFVLTRADDGSYSAVLTSPDQGAIQNIPATSTSFDGSRLALTVDALSGSYEGTLANGRISGNWSQQGTAIPLDLVPYVGSAMTDADKDRLRGSWVGELTIQNTTLAIVFRFEDNDDGEFVGFLDSPDQGANGIAAANVRFADGELKFAVPQIGADYTGTLNGDSLEGTFRQVGQAFPLAMKRGTYTARGLELPQDVIDRIEGSWFGPVQNPAGGKLTLVFRFEANDDGTLTAVMDSPDQGASGIPITEVTVDGDQLSLEVPAARATFTATLGDSSMTGTWAQGNNAQATTMTRGEYTPTVAALDLSDAAMQQLAGTWRGTMGPLELIVRLETNANGDKLAFLDVPAQGAKGLAIPEVALEGDQVTLRVEAAGATISGTLADGKIDGTWQQGPTTNPLTLTRDP